jgi:tetratricopeptide (TPR) repeat protein
MLTPEQAFQRALSLQRLGRLADAERLYRALLKAAPDNFDCLHNLGVVAIRQGRLDEALRMFRRALNQNPASADGRNGLGTVLQALGRLDEAVTQFEKAVAAEPSFAEAHNNLGSVLRALGRHDEALARYRRAVAFDPRYAEAHSNLANLLAALPRHEDAVEAYEAALALRSDCAEDHFNLGNSLQELDRPADAIAHYEAALALKPDYVQAYTNLGAALQALNRYREAVAQYEKALALTPGDANVRWALALAELAAGDYERGWRDYECRWAAPRTRLRRRDFPVPAWEGEERLDGRTILLHSDQGFGDTLQFARYVPVVAAAGAAVLLEVQKPLVSLLASLRGLAQICARGEALPAFDRHCSLQSLPYVFGTRLETIPAVLPYLAPPGDAVERWRARLGARGAPRIGLAWAGNPVQGNDRHRSIPLSRLRPLLAAPFDIVVLQQELREGDTALLEQCHTIALKGVRFADFADTAALISLLDLVITVDSAVAHLAGALGRPLWALLAYATDFRWPVGRADSPWYPTARVFRQPAIGDWDSVVRSVIGALERELL